MSRGSIPRTFMERSYAAMATSTSRRWRYSDEYSVTPFNTRTARRRDFAGDSVSNLGEKLSQVGLGYRRLCLVIGGSDREHAPSGDVRVEPAGCAAGIAGNVCRVWVEVNGDRAEHSVGHRRPRRLTLIVLRAVDTSGGTAPRVRRAGQRQEQQNTAAAAADCWLQPAVVDGKTVLRHDRSGGIGGLRLALHEVQRRAVAGEQNPVRGGLHLEAIVFCDRHGFRPRGNRSRCAV